MPVLFEDVVNFGLLVSLGILSASWVQVLFTFLMVLRRWNARPRGVLFFCKWFAAAAGVASSFLAVVIVIRLLRSSAQPASNMEEAAAFIVVATTLVTLYLRTRWLLRTARQDD